MGIPFAVLHAANPRGLGKADVKLVVAAGAYTGVRCVLISVAAGVVLTVFYCLWHMLLQVFGRRKRDRIMAPLGSCICVGTAVCYYEYFKLHFIVLYDMIN